MVSEECIKWGLFIPHWYTHFVYFIVLSINYITYYIGTQYKILESLLPSLLT